MDKSDLEQNINEYVLWVDTTIENRTLAIYVHNKVSLILSKLVSRKVSPLITGLISSTVVLVVSIVFSLILKQPYIPIFYHLLIIATVTGFTPVIMKNGSRMSNQSFLELTNYIVNEEVLVLQKKWVNKIYSLRKQIIVSILFVILSLTIVRFLEVKYSSIPIYVSFYIAVAFASFLLGNGIYVVIINPSLLIPIRNSRLTLYPLAPADSPFITKAVSAFNRLILGYALGFSLLLLIIIELYRFNPFGDDATLPIASSILIFGLFLISYSFLLPNYLLSQIIKNEKYRVLENLQSKIVDLYRTIQPLDIKKSKDIKAITDIYEIVKSSREYPISFSGFRNYITSMLLPILSFLSGFVDWKIELPSLFN